MGIVPIQLGHVPGDCDGLVRIVFGIKGMVRKYGHRADEQQAPYNQPCSY
jgi:hypothetical protein